MIELKKEELLKSRGINATLNAGYHLLADNFKTIFRHVWPYVLTYAVMFGAWTVFFESLAGQIHTFADSQLVVLMLVVMFAVIIVLYARTFMMLNGQSQRWNLLRSTKLVGFYLLIVVVFSIIVVSVGFLSGGTEGLAVLASNPENVTPETMQPEAGLMAVRMLIVTVVASILLLIFCLPIGYTSMKYMMEPESKLFPTLLGKYGCGLRHWGYIFVCVLVVALCIGVASLVLMLPMYVVQTVQRIDQMGLIGGDESGLPSWFGWLNFGVSTLTYFVYAFLGFVELFVLYYIYGSIEARRKEKELMKIE